MGLNSLRKRNRSDRLGGWNRVRKPLTIAKIGVLSLPVGMLGPVPIATERHGFRPQRPSVWVADSDPGVESQIGFGYLGMLTDVARLFGPTAPRMAAASSPTPTGVAPSVVCGEVHGCRRCRAVTGLNTIPDAITAMEPFRVVALAGLENSPSSGRTLHRRRADILAYFTHRAPNGPTEAMNGRLEALRRTPSASETLPTTESDHCCTAATIPERSMKLKPEEPLHSAGP